MKKWIVIPGVIVVITLVFMAMLGNYSDGDRIGQITKLSSKGFVFKTWEGELVMGGVVEGQSGGSVANVWQFSVDDEQISDQLKKAMDNNEVVKLHYRQVIFKRPWSGSTSYYVDSVKVLPKRKEN